MVVVGVLSVALLVFGLYVYAGGPLPSAPHLLH
jgi:hypothetical protein